MMMEGAIAAVDSAVALGARGRIAPFPMARLRLLRLDALDGDHAARWDRLGAEAETTSVFAQPWFVRQSLEHFGGGQDTVLGFVEDSTGEWLGVLPLGTVSHLGRVPLPHWKGWDHPNQFIGGPLVRHGAAEIFWRVLLPALDRVAPWRFGLRLTNLPLDDAATRALFSLCRQRGRDMMVDRRFARAELVPDQDQGGCHHLPAPFRRRIEGLVRKLEREVGPVEFFTVGAAAQSGPWLEHFLEMENAGWKGSASSSLASTAATTAFFAGVTMAAAQRGELEIAVLRAGGQVIAMSTYFLHGGRGFGFKMAYDQTFRRHAPGLLLMHRLTGRLIEGGVTRFDSCSAPDQEPISRLWQDRREFVDCSVAIGGPLRRGVFRALCAGQKLRRRVTGATGQG